MRDRKCEIVINDDYKLLTRDEIRTVCENINAEYAFIKHDKDTLPDGTPKTPHWHINIRLKDAREFTTFANYFGVTANNVNKIKSYPQSLLYLTHANAPDKYQYDLSEVTANFDLSKLKVTQKNSERKEEIIKSIEDGSIKMYNIYDHITALEYDKYRTAINNTFDYVQKRALLTNKQITVLYLWGDTGTGKTTYAKKYAKDNGKAYYVSSSSNDPLQDYLGQEILILDDLRGDSFTFSDFLKIIDPYNNQSSIKSRYYNKAFLGDTIIITSSKGPKDLYINMADNVNQLIRRLSLVLEFTPTLIREHIYINGKNSIIRDYKNNLLDTYTPPKKLTALDFCPNLKPIVIAEQINFDKM